MKKHILMLPQITNPIITNSNENGLEDIMNKEFKRMIWQQLKQLKQDTNILKTKQKQRDEWNAEVIPSKEYRI